MSYVKVCDRIEAMIEAEQTGYTPIFTFKKVLDNLGLLNSDSLDSKDSLYNVKILWEDNSETWEQLLVFKVDYPITSAEYEDKMNLLNTFG